MKYYTQRPVCSVCEEKEWNSPITDPAFQKLFDFPDEQYRKSSFLRSVRSYYLKYNKLSERQVAALEGFNKGPRANPPSPLISENKGSPEEGDKRVPSEEKPKKKAKSKISKK